MLAPSATFAAGDGNQASCPFETEASPGFRSFLPDCRAYELVTPPYIGGQAVLTNFNRPPEISADGEHILGRGFSGFANTENEEEGALGEYGAMYEFSRTPSGWGTEAVDPPASKYARSNYLRASADLSRTLWGLVLQRAEGEEVGVPEAYTLAVREVVGGHAEFANVGPLEPPDGKRSLGHENETLGQYEFAVIGSSHDLSHLVLSHTTEPNQQWTGDTTREGDPTLYEYVGTGNREPTLVGVTNTGALEGAAINEHAKLVSECGTILGSAHEASTYNAISADGGIVYFTALHAEGCSGSQPAVNELYARVDGATTVAISEPSHEDCAECVETARANAVFQGASEDGAKVFFTTDQELLPGQTGENLYEYDFDAAGGHRITLVSAGSTEPEVTTVVRVSEDGSHVYYLARGALTTGPNQHGERAEAGGYNLYVYNSNAATTRFVASLLTVTEAHVIVSEAEKEGDAAIESEEAECKRFEEEEETERQEECEGEVKRLREALPTKVTETLAREATSRTGATAQDEGRPFETTPDGRFLVFASLRALSGSEDTSAGDQLFEYDAQEETLVRASIGQCPLGTTTCAPSQRYNDNGNTANAANAPAMLTPSYFASEEPTEASSALSISEDGTIVFSSPDALTPSAVTGRENVYEYREGNTYLISPGDEAAPLQKEKPRRLLGADQSGNGVFFFTTDVLVPQDTDTTASWYDARTGGGFSAPPAPVACTASCQGPLSAAPALPNAGSTSSAEGNLTPPVPKPLVKPQTLTRAQKLTKALKACRRRRSRTSRAACEKKAKAKYGKKAKAKSRTKGRAEKSYRRGDS
ncbi:MAG: hypothetical protein ACRD6W_02595 [Nitrososphaerales archaeon]